MPMLRRPWRLANLRDKTSGCKWDLEYLQGIYAKVMDIIDASITMTARKERMEAMGWLACTT